MVTSKAEPLLDVQNLGIRFGGLKAVSDFNMTINQGELLGLIGPNGAGKTTIFNLLTGVYAPTEGQIIFTGKKISGLPPFKVTRKGISRTFQNIRLFKELSVLDNVKIAYHPLATHSIFSSILRLPSHFTNEKEMDEKAIEFLKIFGLDHLKDEKAKNLPYGGQRRLEIARALAADPKLLLLDEPSMGLAPLLVKQIFNIIQEINKDGTTILLVEQNAHMALSIANRAYVIETGSVVLSGNASEMQNSEKVKEAYLGGI